MNHINNGMVTPRLRSWASKKDDQEIASRLNGSPFINPGRRELALADRLVHNRIPK